MDRTSAQPQVNLNCCAINLWKSSLRIVILFPSLCTLSQCLSLSCGLFICLSRKYLIFLKPSPCVFPTYHTLVSQPATPYVLACLSPFTACLHCSMPITNLYPACHFLVCIHVPAYKPILFTFASYLHNRVQQFWLFWQNICKKGF